MFEFRVVDTQPLTAAVFGFNDAFFALFGLANVNVIAIECVASIFQLISTYRLQAQTFPLGTFPYTFFFLFVYTLPRAPPQTLVCLSDMLSAAKRQKSFQF
jgi:hypothetical protein